MEIIKDSIFSTTEADLLETSTKLLNTATELIQNEQTYCDEDALTVAGDIALMSIHVAWTGLGKVLNNHMDDPIMQYCICPFEDDEEDA